MIGLQVHDDKGNHRHFTVFGDEPFRTEVMYNGCTFVYAGATYKDENDPNYEPCFCYDSDNPENKNVLSLSEKEYESLVIKPWVTVVRHLVRRGVPEDWAKAAAKRINASMGYHDPDCQRWSV